MYNIPLIICSRLITDLPRHCAGHRFSNVELSPKHGKDLL